MTEHDRRAASYIFDAPQSLALRIGFHKNRTYGQPFQPPSVILSTKFPMAYRIQKHDLSGVLDQAMAIMKDHFALLLKIVLILQMPFALIIGLVFTSIISMMPPQPQPGAPPEALQQFLNECLATFQEHQSLFIGFGVVTVIGGMVLMPVTSGAIVDAVAKLYLGKPASAGDSIKAAFSRLGPLLWTTFLYMMACMVGYIMCILPSLVPMIMFSLFTHVVMIESISGTVALRRSWDLVATDMKTWFVLAIVVFAINFGTGMVSAIIPQPQIQVVLRTIVQSVVMIMTTSAFVVYYFSCRCHLENFDLEHLAGNLGVEGVVNPDDAIYTAEDIFED